MAHFKTAVLSSNERIDKIAFFLLLILYSCTLLEAFPFSGCTAILDATQTFKTSGWNYIKNWNSKTVVDKPGLFLTGLSVNGGKSTVMVNTPGVFYISYNLIIQTTSSSKFVGGVVFDQNVQSNTALQSHQVSNGGAIGLTAAGFLRLTNFNNLSLAFNATLENGTIAIVQQGSSFTVSLVTTAGAVPAFAFSLKNDKIVTNKTVLSEWSKDKEGEFRVSVGFLPSRNYIQIICDGIYFISANLIIKGPIDSVFILRVNVNLFALHEMRVQMKSGTVKNINIHQIMNLYKGDILKISVENLGSEIEIQKESSFSASLINKISQHATGFASFLRSNFTVANGNSEISIAGWPTDFNGVTEFKSPDLFAQLVNNRKDFNPPERGIYMITTNLELQCEISDCKSVTVSLFSQAAKFSLVTKTLTNVYNHSSYVSLTTTAEILSTGSLSVAVKTHNGKVFVMPGSSFAVLQLPIYYPGMLGRLARPGRFSKTVWETVKEWKTNEIRGGYDFFSAVNTTSGKYQIPFDGIYLVTANVIVADMEEVQALITVKQLLNFDSGLFTKAGNPTTVMTLNVGGLLDLKRNDQVCLMLKSPSDSDWSVKENSGLSVAYIGESSHAFRAYIPTAVQIEKSSWTMIQGWEAKLNFGGSFDATSGRFVIPVSGVYHATANIMVENADQVGPGSEYSLAIRINEATTSGLSAHRSAPQTTPVKRRYYPLFLSGSFKANKGDIVTIAVYSSEDVSFTVLDFSSWSLFLVSENGNNDQIGFGGSKMNVQNVFTTTANSWYDIKDWGSSPTALGSFYTPSQINIDDGVKAIIRTTGFYLISANIKVQHRSSVSAFKIALFIQNELQQNGLSYENIRAWTSFTMHFTGTAFLLQGDTVALKITSTSKFDGLIIFKESGFSIARLPIAELFPGASLISMEKYDIPVSTNVPVSIWTAENSAASFSFTSGKRYNKTSGIFRVRNSGFYLVSMNLILQSESLDQRNISLAIVHGNGKDTYELTLKNGTLSSLSSTVLKFQEVGSTIFIETNISLQQNLSAGFNNSSVLQSNVTLQEGSSFSVIHFPLEKSVTTNEASYIADHSYTIPGMTELSDWTVESQVGTSAAIFRSDKDGIFLLSMNLKLIHFVGCVTFYFRSNKGDLATATVTCPQHCQEYITLNNFVHLRKDDRVSVFMHLQSKGHLTIAKDSRRSITFLRPYEQEVGLSVRIVNTTLLPKTKDKWQTLYRYSLGNNTNGVFDARGNYSSFEGMIIPATGAYQVIINLILMFSNSTQSMGTVEIGVSKDNAVSTSSGLFTKKRFGTGHIFTVHVMSSVVLPKWTKLHLMIRSDTDVFIQEGSTVSLSYLDAIIHERCPDEGPVMGDSLTPAYVVTAVVGEKRKWRCQAFGNQSPVYHWYKDDLIISKTSEWLHLNGSLNDTGTYHCIASINGIMAESNKITVQIYDIDECQYGNHTCDQNATCSNTPGSFKCSCNNGFTGNGFVCNDINECVKETHNCANHSACTNLPGSFTCRCLDGFYGDGVNMCRDIDECIFGALNNCDKHATCTNVMGTYNCTCNKGWFGSGWVCSDSDECLSSTHSCDINAYCNNTNGTASCTCKEGYFGNGIAGNCTDVNECLILPKSAPSHTTNGTDRFKLYCHTDADCVNFKGFYGCRCKPGFTGNGTDCKDINECELGSQSIKCAQTAACVNMPGSYQCKCRSGYTGDGIQCTDVNECAAKTFICDPLANCSNSYGSYQCSCPKGYIGDGKTCAANAEIGKSTDPCTKDSSSLTCICKNSKTRDQNILCNGLFVAIIILSVVAIIVIVFVIKYIKSRRNIKIGPVKTPRGKYIEMEDESEV